MAETNSNESEKKSSKKMIIIIAVIVLLLGGAGAGYFFFMYKPTDAEATKEADKESSKQKEEKIEETSEPEVYYDLVNPLLVNFPRDSSAKIIKISVAVLLKGETNIEALKKHEPMIRNNLLMAISSMGADKLKTIEGKKELQAVMLGEIGKVLDKMIKKNPVKNVYFTEFVMQ